MVKSYTPKEEAKESKSTDSKEVEGLKKGRDETYSQMHPNMAAEMKKLK